ncbi:hypothetical protein BgiMline_029175 [Biomphalaria glabrata]
MKLEWCMQTQDPVAIESHRRIVVGNIFNPEDEIGVVHADPRPSCDRIPQEDSSRQYFNPEDEIGVVHADPRPSCDRIPQEDSSRQYLQSRR